MLRDTHESTRRRPPLAYEVMFFCALLATTLAVGGGLAHVFALPNKIGMDADQYFAAQQAYRGWALFGFVLGAQLIFLIALAIMSRRAPGVLWPVLGAIALLVVSQAVFWAYTFPANVATGNWLEVPANWEALRAEWEYSHLAGGLCQLGALCLLFVAALARGRRAGGG